MICTQPNLRFQEASSAPASPSEQSSTQQGLRSTLLQGAADASVEGSPPCPRSSDTWLEDGWTAEDLDRPLPMEWFDDASMMDEDGEQGRPNDVHDPDFHAFLGVFLVRRKFDVMEAQSQILWCDC